MTDHMRALKQSGLINNLKTFQIGIVGAEETRNEVRAYLDSENIEYSICAEVDDGWEQETQDKIFDFAQENDGYVLYAHTKNAVNINPLHIAWRLSMTYHSVILWEDATRKLEVYSAVGSHYLESGIQTNRTNTSTEIGFFAGTFWWTHLKYIRNFPSKPDRANRYCAEGWIFMLKETVESMGEEYIIYDYVPYHPGEETGMVTLW